MRPTRAYLASVALLLFSVADIRAQTLPPHVGASTRDERIVAALEQEWLEHEHDRATLERILADDFVHPVPQGIFLTKQQHIDWAVSHPAPLGRTLRFERLDVRRFGDVEIASGIVLDTDASGSDARRTIFTDVFAWREGLWRAVNAQENAIEATHK